MSSFVTCFWEDVNIKGCVGQDKLAQLLSLPPFQAVSLCFCSIYLCFYLAFMIFVHPAESRAQPSARAASRRIGQKSCSQTGLNLIGHNGDDVKSRLVTVPSGLSLIGWCLEEVAVEYSRFFGEWAFSLKRWYLSGTLGTLREHSGGVGGKAGEDSHLYSRGDWE